MCSMGRPGKSAMNEAVKGMMALLRLRCHEIFCMRRNWNCRIRGRGNGLRSRARSQRNCRRSWRKLRETSLTSCLQSAFETGWGSRPAGGYNVEIDGNFGDEIHYQLRTRSSDAAGGERDFTVGGTSLGSSN